MKIEKLIDRGYPKLILCFNGWSAPLALFRQLAVPADADYRVVYDYHDSQFDTDLGTYAEVQVYAWSLGVWVASQVLLTLPHVRITKSVAINGTPSPLSATEGIPEVAFRATLHHLTLEGIRLFNQRICASPENIAQYEAYTPRPLAEVADELRFLYKQIKGTKVPTDFPWSQAYVSSPAIGDAIFPVANQLRAWESHQVPVQFLQAPHCPFFQYPNLFAL